MIYFVIQHSTLPSHMMCVDKTSESVFNFYVDKIKVETRKSIFKIFILMLSNNILMQHGMAVCGNWMSDCIIEIT